MSRGLLYWIIVVIWVVLALGVRFGVGGTYGVYANDIVLLILFILLGWSVFGPPIHG